MIEPVFQLGDLADTVRQALNEAVQQALVRHHQADNPVAVWLEDHVELVPAAKALGWFATAPDQGRSLGHPSS